MAAGLGVGCDIDISMQGLVILPFSPVSPVLCQVFTLASFCRPACM